MGAAAAVSKDQTHEPQYNTLLDLRDSKGLTQLGLHANQIFHDDPKRLAIMLARYKFVAKMLSGKQRVLEVGCGDAFGTRIVLQEVGSICAVDFDPVFVEDVNQRMEEQWEFECRVHDILAGPVDGLFDAAYALDVLEHIPQTEEHLFMSNAAGSLKEQGILVIGVPSIQSQAHASKRSKEGHVNCKDAQGLKSLMLEHFHNVFTFSMNDEVVHTGFYPMAQYLIALGVGKRSAN